MRRGWLLWAALPLALAAPVLADDDSPRAATAAYEAARAAEASAAPADVPEPEPAVAASDPKAAAQRGARRGSSQAGSLGPLIAQHAREQDVPVGIAHGVIMVESRFDPNARNGVHMGLTQISVATARAMGYSGSANGLLDPATNLRFGLRYLGQAYRLAGGDTCRTIMKYKGGHRAVTMTASARSYCNRVKTTVDTLN
jgi:soluble lytic murein transglycosylase-like protein